IILKPSLHGGFAGSDEWMALAEERGIGYWATSALESNVGLNAIAQWCSHWPSHRDLPQGLGTGQLFTDNYPHLSLCIEGQYLWAHPAEQRAFESEVQQFRKEWQSDSPTLPVQTSGSTGAPKLMEAAKHHMRASAEMTLRFFQLHSGHIAMLCLPLQYIAGKMMVVRAEVGQLRLLPVVPSTHPFKHLTAPPDFVALTPMQALLTLQTPGERELLQATPHVLIGGGSVSDELLEAVQSCRGEVWSSYGMTETLSHIAMRRLNGASASRCYTPLPGVRLAVNSSGCLVIDAPAVCEQQLTTNDCVELHPDGSFEVLGRIDNVICSGGIKLQVEQLERQLEHLPCNYMITAVPDPVLGEAVVLLHTATSADVPALCAQRLDRHALPHHYIYMEQLPQTATGKPARQQARQWAESHLAAVRDAQ
ncbi:MAG: AMP-binding protein, partial [Bacteroidaceae bacterium]|nr:AMP-binding protein [Bacteroidaceae bacterium]